MGGKSRTFVVVVNEHFVSGKLESVFGLKVLAANGRELPHQPPNDNDAAILVVDAAQTMYGAAAELAAVWARQHYTNKKENRAQAASGGLGPDDVASSVRWTLKWRLEAAEDLRRLLNPRQHTIFVELLNDGRFPKHRPPSKPSHGDMARVFKQLEKFPRRVTDGRKTRTLPNDVVVRSFNGVKDPSSNLAELMQNSVVDPASTEVMNVVHADAHFFDYDCAGVQIVHTADRDALITLSFCREPRLSHWLVISSFDSVSRECTVADALYAHDSLVRHFLPVSVRRFSPPPLIFSKSLPQWDVERRELNMWLAGLFVICQNGASDYGASLVHFSAQSKSTSAVSAPLILKHFDDYAAQQDVSR